MKVFAKYKANDTDYTLCFVVNNDHLYPVLDSNTKRSVVASGHLQLNEYKFNISYDSIDFFPHYTKQILVQTDIEHDVLLNLMYDVQEKSKTMIEYIKFNNGKPTAFQHPITKQIYELTDRFYERETILKFLASKYGKLLIDFKNQSYTQISQLIFDNEFGYTKQLKSNLSNKLFDLFEQYKIQPYCRTTTLNPKDFIQGSDCFGFDICKSYSSALICNDVSFSIFQPFDEPQLYNEKIKLVPGEYFIDKKIILCDGFMVYPRGFYPLNFVNFLISNNIITKKDITAYIPAKQFIKADVFNKFVIYVYKNFDEADAKIIINNFIGDLGTKYIKSDKGCITSSYEIAVAILIQEKTNLMMYALILIMICIL